MTKFVGPVRRRDTANAPRFYDANGHRVPGVTSVMDGGLPKAGLIKWAAEATAAYAVDHWAELSKLSPSERLRRLERCRFESRDAAGKRGKEIHTAGEKLAAGQEVTLDDEIAGHIESYVAFLDAFDPEAVLTEVTIFSHTQGYAGFLDAVFRFPFPMPPLFPQPKPLLLCDIKTNKSGVWGDTALQLAGYRYADSYVDDDGNEQPMIEVDGAAVIHVRADGADLIPVIAGPQQFRDLLYVAQVKRFDETSRDLVGNPIVPPNQLRRRRLEILPDTEELAS